MLTFQKNYFLLMLLLLVTEVLIALYLHDGFIRPYLGDILVVILLYCFLKSFIKMEAVKAAVLVLLFAYAIELLQYLQFINWIGLEENTFAKVVLGSQFDWKDILAYTVGALVIIFIEKWNLSRATKRNVSL